MSSNPDCDNGDKFVLKNTARVNRRQFLFMDGKTILAFVPIGQKFTQCSSYTEVTALVDCKVLICPHLFHSISYTNVQICRRWKEHWIYLFRHHVTQMEVHQMEVLQCQTDQQVSFLDAFFSISGLLFGVY